MAPVSLATAMDTTPSNLFIASKSTGLIAAG